MSIKTIYDRSGNRIGEDVITTGRDGLVHITHYDTHNNRLGRSYQTRDYHGQVYMIHEDSHGQVLARSTLERDWWGDYYVKTDTTRLFTEQEAKFQKTGDSRRDITAESSSFDFSDLLGMLAYGIWWLIKNFFKLFCKLYCYMFLLCLLLIPPSGIPSIIAIAGVAMDWLDPSSSVILERLHALLLLAYLPAIIPMMIWRKKREIRTRTVAAFCIQWFFLAVFAYPYFFRIRRQVLENRTAQK